MLYLSVLVVAAGLFCKNKRVDIEPGFRLFSNPTECSVGF
ncbi:protein of unknown function [Maridesulfovibrio hydrothermalis AM13 = DSM 14728]|uniref:Uncharacterized protein n=1 Tax=Maridesulfovibrio hydrothermalis AM13 = DSM 14728 TaxID=1121451 RepID=L0REY7_9BACT|nr:protein of unknown function [Maridesulfovibrio hydrothermalis AM13 = DSM 14728]